MSSKSVSERALESFISKLESDPKISSELKAKLSSLASTDSWTSSTAVSSAINEVCRKPEEKL